MNNTQPLVRVGVAVIAIRDGKVLLGKRKGSHGAGTWALPGGHLEFGESFVAAAKRELVEETGMQAESVELGPYTNDFKPEEHKHYITIFTIVKDPIGQPEVKEPEKSEGWELMKWDEFPSPLFLPLKNLLANDFNPFKDSDSKGFDV